MLESFVSILPADWFSLSEWPRFHCKELIHFSHHSRQCHMTANLRSADLSGHVLWFDSTTFTF